MSACIQCATKGFHVHRERQYHRPGIHPTVPSHHAHLPYRQAASPHPSQAPTASYASRTTQNRPSRRYPSKHSQLPLFLTNSTSTSNDSPIVRLRLRELLMSQKPSMGVRRMDDVHVSPDERPRRCGERKRRERSLSMHVIVSFSGAPAGRAGAEAQAS